MDKQTALAAEIRRKYAREYEARNKEKVAQWRKNSIVNAYKRLVEAEPEFAIDGGTR